MLASAGSGTSFARPSHFCLKFYCKHADVVYIVPNPRCVPRGHRLSVVLFAASILSAEAGCHSSAKAPAARGGAAPTLKRGDGSEYFAHEVIIKVASTTSVQALNASLAKVGGRIIDADSLMAELGYRRVELPSSITADVAISQLAGEASIQKAEVNYVVQAFVTPNDTRFGELWGMAKINAPAAWDITTGSASVLVAISDTGIDYTHPDLVANVWTNPGEIPGNGKDDDGNGYVDDIHGYDFANTDADPMDDHGHGTHVSGTIGGVANNSTGVAGLNWNVRLIGTKFLTASGGGSLWAGAQTILYAAKMKARVVNASWGCLGAGCYASYMEDSLRTLDAAGGLFVAAAGNDANNNDATPTYPANYAVPNVITVAATDSNDALASFSNYGATKVHLAAPGVGILSTLKGNAYASWSGTSMATPHVAGAAALMAGLRPDASPEEIKQKLMDTCDPVAGLGGKTVTGGRLNVQRLVASAGHAPAIPTGFKGSAGGSSDVLLSWNANSETDLAGYRLRWGTSSGVYNNTLNLGKDITSTRIPDLLQGTKYFFVLNALGATGLLSANSTEIAITAVDGVPPAQVVDLAASVVPGTQASGELVATSGEFSAFWSAANAVDGSPDTAWISPGREAPQEESLTFALFSPYLIDSVDLLPSASYPDFFPIDFDVEISTDGESWTAVGGQRGAHVAVGQHMRILFSPTLASQVRLRVLRSAQHQSGTYYAAIAEMAVSEASSAPDSLLLSFTAPGDDGGQGRAQSYDIRRANSALTTATFDSAIQVSSTGQPVAGGLREQKTVSGLQGETTYYFAMKAVDDGGNRSLMSNVASATTLLIPPSTITDLRVSNTAADTNHPGMVVLLWTAPGSDGKSGQAQKYDLRISRTPMTAGDFASATAVAGVPTPAIAGAAERFAVSGLEAGKTYYFALRASDMAGAVGGVSNVVSAVPPDGDDVTPPATVPDLNAMLSNAAVKLTATVDSVSDELSTARAAVNLLDGNVATAWMTKAAARDAPAWVIFDLGSVQPLVRFRANPSSNDLIASYPQDFQIQTSSDKTNWATLVNVQGLLGEFAKWNTWASPVTNARYVRLYITNRGPAVGTAVYAAMGEFEMYALTPALDADLTWVAPGDDGYDGVATAYDLRQSTAPINTANFASAQAVTTLSPLPGGMIEVLHLPNVPMEATVYYGLKAVDNNGNWSGLSNLATLTTPGMNPSPVTNLSVAGATTQSITLAFTATGDDGNVGTATSYDVRYSTTPMSLASWATATPATVAAPHVAGTAETVTVTGLQPTTLYYFGVVVVDDVGNRSLLSNVAAGSTRDGTPPSAIADLIATAIDPTQKSAITMTIADTNGSYSTDTAAKNLLDANDATTWMGLDLSQSGQDYVQFDLGGQKRIGRLRMRAPPTYQAMFPVDFRVEIQAQTGSAWTVLLRETAFTTAGGWEEWSLGSVSAVAARLVVTNTGLSLGRHTPAVADFELYEDPSDFGKVRLAWTATGDDGTSGTAVRYDLRRAPTAISDGTWSASTALTPVPTPRASGSAETYDASGLAAKTTYCFGVKAIDDEGNTSAASNSPCTTTPGVPPATISDLTAIAATARTATVTFTAPGADGNVGQATSYELRRSTRRINSANWSSATVVTPVPAPHTAGTTEGITATGLAELTTYYFAVRAIDETNTAGALSNNATITTMDGTPPNAIVDLAATPVDPAQRPALTLTVASSSGSYSTDTQAKNVLDGLDTTAWMSQDIGTNGQALVQFDLGGQKRLGRLRMRAAANYRDLFPVDFRMETQSQTGGTWTPVVRETAFTTAGGWEEWMLGSVSAVSARLVITKANAWTGRYIPTIGDVELYEDPADYSKLRLSWTATGDDGNSGAATRYDLRRASAAMVEATFVAGSALPSAPTPQAAGYLERYEASGLSAETTYCFAIKAIDDVGNTGAVSNSPCATTPGIPPATITDLLVSATSAKTATLTFTAPGADGNVGQASTYEVRRSSKRINTGNWSAATIVTPVSAPRAAGNAESVTVSGLTGLTTYFFAVRALDATGNASAISNNATGTTLDDIAPSAVSDLAASTNTAQGGSLYLTWTAPGDNGIGGQAKSYDARIATTVITDATFASATPIAVGAPAVGGTRQTASVTGLAGETLYYVALKTIDAAGNVSALSNVTSAPTREEPPSAITDLAVIGGSGRSASNATMVIQWTAPGDDGTVGTAQSYEIRYAAGTISASTFASATLVTPGITPAPAGTIQQLTIGNLSAGIKYTVAMRAVDKRGNVSALSNVASGTTPDEVAPSTTTDLVAATGTATGALSLSFTAPGDDGTSGRATAYDVRWSLNAIDANSFASATTLTSPTPSTAGALQTFTVSGLPDETTVHIALRTRDDVGNWSGVSNDASAMTMDVAPAAITDLQTIAKGAGTFTLGWTATGDDGKVGTAVAYEMRYSETTLSDATFATATLAPTPLPSGAGAAQTATITGLGANKTYFFAIRARDDRGNWSPLSNVLSSATEDTIAPGAIALTATTGSSAGTIALSWTATGDDGTTGTAKRYELRRSASVITANNWSTATIVTAPAPKVAGSPETTSVTGLTGETTHHFAIRAFDEVDNVGPISNDAYANTPPVAPAAVVLTATLVVSNGTASATLSWTAPGDDGTVGQATAYDIRSSTTSLSASNFVSATVVTAPTPAAAGTPQSVVVTGLKEATTYSFAMRTVDDTQTWSSLSNVATVTVPDMTKPGAPSALSVGVPDVLGKAIAITQVTASSVLSPSWDSSNLIDGDPTSSWASTGTDASSAESLVLDLGTSQSIEQIKLTPDAKYLDLFPRGFTLDVSVDKNSWKTIASEQAFKVTTADVLTWGFPAESARYVRIAIDDTGSSFGKHYVILADVEVDSAAAGDGRAQLTWLAPGDDLYSGKATRYEIYRSTRAFTEAELASVTLVSGPPAPMDSGSLQTMTVTALHGETTYYWAIRAIDEAGNLGTLSAVVSGKTNNVAPAAVRDLAGQASSGTSIALSWSATGDDGQTGTAQSYEIRYLTGPMNARTFAQGTLVANLPPPAPAKTKQTVTVSGLTPGSAYRFALVATDAGGNASFLSNVALVSTNRPADTTPPATVSDLTVRIPQAGGRVVAGTLSGKSSEQSPDFPATSAVDGNMSSFWASTARTVSQEEWIRVQYTTAVTADHVRLWPASSFTDLFPPDVVVRVSPDGLSWTTVATQTGITASAGNATSIAFAATSLKFIEVRATRLAHHSSGMYYAVIAEVELLTASEPAGTIVASWTAPSDDGTSGNAAAYDLRVGACPFNAATATAVSTTTPSEAGSPERYRITGRTTGTYCVAVASRDAAGNVSVWSNSASIAVP